MTPRKIAAFAVGPIGAALIGLITLPTITWFFAQEDVGRLSMLQVVLGFSVLLFSLGLDQSYVREFHESDDKSQLLKHALSPGLLILLVVLGGLLASGNLLSELVFGVSSASLDWLIALALLASFISRFLSLILRMRERGLAYSMSQLLPKALLLVIVGVYVVFGAEKSLTNLILAYTATFIFVCCIYGWNTRSEWIPSVKASVNADKLKAMLRFGSPLILGGLAFWGLTAVDKVFLRGLSNFEELALYSVSVSFAAAATILNSIFSTIWAPTVYKWASEGHGIEKVEKVTKYMLALVVFAFCMTGLLSWTTTFLLPANYVDVQWIVISCVGYPLLYLLSETTVVGIGITRKSSYAMFAAALAFIVNVLGNWFLIPIYGAKGAAVSTCFSFWVFLILRTEFSSFLWQRISTGRLYILSSICVIGAIASTLFGEVLGNRMLVFWACFLVFSVIIFRNEVKAAQCFICSRVLGSRVVN